MSELRIDIWSDIACPWCYVGKRRLEAALARFEHAGDVRIVWRAFELDPSAPRTRSDEQSQVDRLAAKYGMSRAQAEQRIQHLVELAAADGLELRFDRIRPGNTFDAHRLLHLAHERGCQDALKERLMRAYLTEGVSIGDPAALLPLAVDSGLDEAEARAVLESDRYAVEVRADETEAQHLGIHGVPFFVIGGRLGVSGAQPAATLLSAFAQAWNELPAAAAIDGQACGPDGCAV